MADAEQLERLRGGVPGWNDWRRQNHNEEIAIDLTDADLRSTDLSQANLTDANLFAADLSGANLSEADLSGATLDDANLSHAHLGWVKFNQANLICANLSGAHLIAADLIGANLCYAILIRINLTEARLGETIFGDVDMNSAIGLETCNHESPSIIDHRTLGRSANLPINFLRGCGLPDLFIENIPILFHGTGTTFYSCFISYSHNDEEFAQRLYADLQNNGVRCWYAPEDMKTGAEITRTIDEAVYAYDKLLLVLSEQSVESGWVEREVSQAIAKEKKSKGLVLFPVQVDKTVNECPYNWVNMIRKKRHIGDFAGWKNHDAYKKAFDRLLRDLKSATANR